MDKKVIKTKYFKFDYQDRDKKYLIYGTDGKYCGCLEFNSNANSWLLAPYHEIRLAPHLLYEICSIIEELNKWIDTFLAGD